MIRLSSYVQDQWIEGTGTPAVLVNPSTEEEVACASTEGIDMAAALAHSREIGGPALRAMTFAQRGELLKQMANALHEYREELLDIAERNNGGTRGDAKFDRSESIFKIEPKPSLSVRHILTRLFHPAPLLRNRIPVPPSCDPLRCNAQDRGEHVSLWYLSHRSIHL